MPLHRLAATTFHRLTDTTKKSAEVKIKVQFKIFCNLPVNMSDENFGLLFGGTVRETLDRFNRRTMNKLAYHEGASIPLASAELARNNGTTIYKKYPMYLPKLLNTIYKSRCGGTNPITNKSCGGFITNTGHLRETHKYNI
jgi:hypothetical protein